MNDKKKTTTKNRPVHLIRSQEISATVYMKQSNAGFCYFDYTIGRNWRSQASGKEAHGVSFFDKHQDAIIEVVMEASAWIRAQLQANAANQDGNADGIPAAD
jgi:hypothetical protein